MRLFRFLRPAPLMVLLLLVLVGCKSVEEQAEEHFQSGLALMESGDYDRAIIEFRNVFQLNGSHQEARHKLAEIHLDHRDDMRSAYGQYLRLVEQYPDDFKARIALAELAFMVQNWEDVERHGAAVERLNPEDPRSKAIIIARAYRAAALAENNSDLRAQAQAAKALLETQSDSVILRSIVLDSHLRDSDTTAALAQIDWLLERDPDNLTYWRQRLLVLSQRDDMEGIEQQLREMVERFPEDTNNKQSLIRFYMSRGQTDEVETFLRQQVADAGDNETGARADLIRFLAEVRGRAEAREEIDKAIEAGVDTVVFRALRAGMDFEAGAREAAVKELQDVLETAEPSSEVNDVKGVLAKMLQTMGNEVGARALVEELLAEEPGHAEALKMQATWYLQADDIDAAIASLRSALDTDSDDAEAMTLMAQAHQRAGRPELARDFLSLAVDASGNAPTETLRYASLLIEDESYLPAEDILLQALRLAPQNTGILQALGEIYLRTDDAGRLSQVIESLRRMDNPDAVRSANGLEAARINSQSGIEEALQYLEDLANSADASLSSQVALVQALLRTGNTDAALEKARDLQQENPQNEVIQAVLAATETANGNFDTAEALYRDLLATDAQRAGVWGELAKLAMRQGDPDAARTVIDEGLSAVPGDPALLWAKATYEERNGNIDAAIEIYEDLYATRPTSSIIANNLASMLATYRSDEESLERAWTVARRFKETDVPAMQDTYGWIAHRRGDSAEALPYLEAAARGLPSDPIVQYHLAQVYLALEMPAKALAQFRIAVEVAGPIDQRTQIEEARAQVQTLAETVEN
ncbi:tetratricopeptide repeat protein [uncultured Roseobacter sp.]|uniref:tetratricopeptide repeat protein n=1 Tax=uncultured Roseobacter sp. TaxID=114847 RepID=UPI0026104925|nr:tetratricopeptide repeat protein [uncultured Roseobacter sp.]